MKNTKHLSMLIVAVLFSAIAFGQKHHNKGERQRPTKEKVKAMKIAYITNELDLTSDEAQKFWPVYNELEAKMSEFHKARKAAHKKEKEETEPSDAQLEKMINKRFAAKQKELDLRKEYYPKFKAVLPIQKVAKLYKSEHSFKRNLLKKMRVKKGGPNELNIPPPPHQH